MAGRSTGDAGTPTWSVGRSRTATVDAVGYAGAGALALLDDEGLDALLSPIPGEVVANNRFSADAFVVAGDLDRALATLEGMRERQRCAASAQRRGMGAGATSVRPAWGRFDVDTTLDLALLRLATRLDGTRSLDGSVRGFLEMARLPGDRPLEVPNLDRLGAVIRDRSAELVVAGRVPTTTWQMLETETACRVRGLVEERGMRSSGAAQVPRSILAALMDRSSPTELVAELARLGDAIVLDTRVLMAAVAASAEAASVASRGGAFCIGLRRRFPGRDALAARAGGGSGEGIGPDAVRRARPHQRRAAVDRVGRLAGPIAPARL